MSGFCYRRLTSENILIDAEFKVKLCDFGYPVSTSSNETDDDFHLRFRAPELLRSKPFNAYAGDIWSLYVALFLTHTTNKKGKHSDDSHSSAKLGGGGVSFMSLTYTHQSNIQSILCLVFFVCMQQPCNVQTTVDKNLNKNCTL